MITQLAVRAHASVWNTIVPVLQGPATDGGSGTDPAVEEAKNSVTSSELWQNVIVPISVAIGIIVVVYGLWRTITKTLSGKPGEAVKSIVGTIVVAAFLFNLGLLFDIIGALGDVLGTLVGSATDLTDGK